MPTIFIDSLDDPAVDVYRSLKKTNFNRWKDVFIAEGINVVKRLIDSSFEVESVLVTDNKLAQIQTMLPSDVPIYVLPRNLATLLVGFTFHMGILAIGKRKSPDLKSHLAANPDGQLILVSDQIIDQQNVGLLIRIASAFGATALIFTHGSADPFSRRAIRVSMGNGFSLPVFQADKTLPVLSLLGEHGYQSFATVLDSTARSVSGFQLPPKAALVFGNESHGLPAEIQDACHERLRIDMLNDTDSLNIAISAGIFSYAYRTQQAP